MSSSKQANTGPIYDNIDAPVQLPIDETIDLKIQNAPNIKSEPSNQQDQITPPSKLPETVVSSNPQLQQQQPYYVPAQNQNGQQQQYQNHQYQPAQIPSKYVYQQQTRPQVIVIHEKVDDNDIADAATCACLSGMLAALCCCMMCH